MEPAGRGSEPAGRALEPAGRALKPVRRTSEPGGRPQGGTNGRTNGWTENLPILQDFVPYRGRCPKRNNRIKQKGMAREPLII